MLHLALDFENLVELREERRLIHAFLFCQHRERGGFAFHLHAQLIGTLLRLLPTGADCLQLLRSQSDSVLRPEHEFRWIKYPYERIGGFLGMIRREQRTERSKEGNESNEFHGVFGCGVGLHCKRDHRGMRGSSSSESVGDAHAGNNEGGSIESRAMAFCVEEMVATMSG